MSRIVTTKHRCDLCTKELTTTICPTDWLEVPLKFDDGMTDIPDVVVKHLCAGCAKQTAESLQQSGKVSLILDFAAPATQQPREATR